MLTWKSAKHEHFHSAQLHSKQQLLVNWDSVMHLHQKPYFHNHVDSQITGVCFHTGRVWKGSLPTWPLYLYHLYPVLMWMINDSAAFDVNDVFAVFYEELKEPTNHCIYGSRGRDIGFQTERDRIRSWIDAPCRKCSSLGAGETREL